MIFGEVLLWAAFAAAAPGGRLAAAQGPASAAPTAAHVSSSTPASPSPEAAPAPAPAAPPAASAAALAGAKPNLVVVSYEVIERPEQEGVSATRIYVDGEFVAQTPAGLRSAQQRWEGRLEPGNRLVRLERWLLPDVSDWVKAGGEQPRERFVRVEEGSTAVVTLRYYDDGRKHALAVSRQSP